MVSVVIITLALLFVGLVAWGFVTDQNMQAHERKLRNEYWRKLYGMTWDQAQDDFDRRHGR